MRAIKSKKVLIVALSVIAAFMISIGVCTISPKQVEAQTIQVSNIVESDIALNTEMEGPESVSVEYKGTHTASNGVVVFPNGNIVTYDPLPTSILISGIAGFIATTYVFSECCWLFVGSAYETAFMYFLDANDFVIPAVRYEP